MKALHKPVDGIVLVVCSVVVERGHVEEKTRPAATPASQIAASPLFLLTETSRWAWGRSRWVARAMREGRVRNKARRVPEKDCNLESLETSKAPSQNR